MFENIRKKLFNPNSKQVAPVPSARNSYTISSLGGWTPTWDKGSVYDNSYASIKAIANAFVDIEPYAVNENGREVQTAVIDAINNPNDRMSGPVFREALAVMTLTHRKAYILVWHREDGDVKPGGVGASADNIAGFTFLENVSETIVNGVKTYYTTAYGTLGEQDVMEISVGVNPYNLSAGYSPAVAVKKWASVDDYIVAYEAGLFENNAVPDGQFTITAQTQEAFKDIVQNMQAKHRGSGKNGNVQYVWKPVDPATGLAQSAQVEWQAFSQPNNSLALDKIFEQVNEKLDSAYGVPASIRGVSNNNNYASSAVDEAHFMKFTIKPFATKIWGAFEHELSRIVGELDFSITFDLDEVSMADEQKVVADTKKTEMDILTAGLNAGYTAEQVINGFGLDIDFEALGEPKTIDEPSEPETTSEEAEKSVEVKKKIDSHCTCGHCHKKAELNREQRTVYSELKEVASEQVDSQAGQVIDELENQTEAGDFDYEALEARAGTTDKQNLAFASGMMAVLAGYMVKTGKKTYKKGEKMLPAGTTGAEGYELSQETRRSYEDYLKNVASAFNGDTTGRIKEILSLANAEGWNKTKLYNALKAISGDSEAWRIERLAYNEERRAWNMADLDAMVTLQNQTGVRISKTWHTADSGACDYCKEMAGKTENVSDSFLSKNDVLELEDGSMFLNDFVDMEVAQLHPNCVLGDTKVLADNVELATKMMYSGDIVKLTTKGGRSLSVTPNHILLTNRGWVAAKNLKKSDKIVAHSDSIKGFISDNTVDRDIPTISEQFISISESDGVSSVKVPVSAEDFKGDGVADENVDVIFADGFLSSKRNVSSGKFGCNLPFVGGVVANKSLSGLSTLDQFLVGTLATTNGFVGSTSEGLALLGSGASHPGIHSLTSASAYNARLIEAASDSSTADIELLSKSFLADTGLVEFDDLLSIEIDSVHDTPVYDLQTTSTLYSANGIVSSNCRCYCQYKVEGR